MGPEVIWLQNNWFNILEVIAFMLAGWRAFSKLQQKQSESLSELRGGQREIFVTLNEFKIRLEKVELGIEAHIMSASPHMSCPDHTRALADVSGRLDRIQSDVRGTQQWLIAYLLSDRSKMLELSTKLMEDIK